ncbi:hypothetical protein Tco_0654869 [Tanacetum coccineum]|uniref:Reverse transcriptase domain-containing protein n=1 Tax=Tanacetum coccineum TaxID=301880 RepID=A0ABQ4X5D3_9ASTR
MTGVPRQIAKHKLNVRKGYQPVRQKKRGQAAERSVAINDEVSKLVKARIMREVSLTQLVSPTGMVKKSYNSWRMCVEFKDLNKACPKDGYPLPEIDWKVESLCGFPFKCFLDAYKGYHQIQMAEEDEEKTTFITNQDRSKLPRGIRDDMVIKSRTKDEVVRDIEETFKTLRKINMKLKPKKCTFGVEEGMFLGYQVNTKGIRICPDKEAEAASHNEEHISKFTICHRSIRTRGTHCLPGASRSDQRRKDMTTPQEKKSRSRTVEPCTAHGRSSAFDGLQFRSDAHGSGGEYKTDTNQVNGTYIAKETDMIKYLEKVKALTSTFRAFSISRFREDKTKRPDALTKWHTILHLLMATSVGGGIERKSVTKEVHAV